jgi:hypothetical protein
MSSPKDTALLSLRTTVILLGALLIGVAAGGLTHLTYRHLAQAALAAGAGFSASALWLHKIIAPKPGRPCRDAGKIDKTCLFTSTRLRRVVRGC